MDRVMSSYRSSVKSLAIIRTDGSPKLKSSEISALIVAMPDTPGSKHLTFAAQEAAMLQKTFSEMDFKISQPKRTKTAVAEQLQESYSFHFAGHGHTDAANPSDSHLKLLDWREAPLSVNYLLTLNLRKPKPFLAYLSACGTGQIEDSKYFDKNIHLISACQLAGLRHVIMGSE